MLLELIIALLIGVTCGTITGLIPGIHINLIGAMLISLSASSLLKFDPIYIVSFIATMAITHTFVDFIPSIFLGCPDTDTELSILPGHEMLKQGKAHEGVMLTACGSLAAVIISAFIAYPSTFLIAKAYELLRDIIPYLLIAVSVILIIMERDRFRAGVIFALTGILGYITLNSTINQPLLPLLTGLFGASSLIISLKNKTVIPTQTITEEKPKMLKPLIGSFIASPICSFLPGLGSGQAAIIGNTISKTDKRGFLVLLGATNTFVMAFSFFSLYAISRTRTGAAVAIKDIVGTLDFQTFILISVIVLISGTFAFFITKSLSEKISSKITKINYSKITITTILILTIVTIFVSGFAGLILLAVSTITGIYAINSKVRRTNMMGCLLIPTIVLYLF